MCHADTGDMELPSLNCAVVTGATIMKMFRSKMLAAALLAGGAAASKAEPYARVKLERRDPAEIVQAVRSGRAP